MRNLRPFAALLIPLALAVASLAPVVLLNPPTDLPAYERHGYAAGSTDYWYPPPAFDASMTLRRFNDETLSVTALNDVALVGPGFAGDSWVFTIDYVELAEGPRGTAVLSFAGSEPAEPSLDPPKGLRLIIGPDAGDGPTEEPSVAIGTAPPYSIVPLRVGRRRFVIESSWTEASVSLDGALVWSGDPGWGGLPGAYPVLRLGRGEHRISVVPSIDASFVRRPAADPAAFRSSFVKAALARQTADGRFSDDVRTDSWTALALVFEHRRAPTPSLAVALDRWAAGRADAARPGASWPGPSGPSSIRDNVGEPGIALALWAKDRGQADWTVTVASAIEAAGFSGCENARVDWCRLGNLQPDGSVVHAGEPGATTRLTDFQAAETAGFIAGADIEDRRAWIRALVRRTFTRQHCQIAAGLGPNRDDIDLNPWSLEARTSHPTTLFLLGLAYAERPDDPVWTEPDVRRLLTCGTELLEIQVGGPLGWRSNQVDSRIGQDTAASRLLQPLTDVTLDRRRFDVAWELLIDPTSLVARTGPDDPNALAGYRTAVAAAMLGVIDR